MKKITGLLVGALLVVASGCEPTRNTQMVELNGIEFGMSYTTWKWYSVSSSANGKRYYPYMDWSTDECSAIGNGPWDFKYPCRRHDSRGATSSGSVEGST